MFWAVAPPKKYETVTVLSTTVLGLNNVKSRRKRKEEKVTARKRKAKHKRRKRTIENNTQICKENSATGDLQSRVLADGEVRCKRYKTLLLDPPWDVFQRGNYGAHKHYNLMSLKEIKALPIAELAEENAHCWLWVTNNTLRVGFDIMEEWGFPVKSVFTWIKLRMGLGNTLRSCTEHVLLGIRGKCPVKVKNQINFGIFTPKCEHSHKPEEFHEIIQRVSPGPYLEMFARRRPSSPEWDVWGNEIDSDIVIPGYPVPEYSGRAFMTDKPKEQEV